MAYCPTRCSVASSFGFQLWLPALACTYGLHLRLAHFELGGVSSRFVTSTRKNPRKLESPCFSSLVCENLLSASSSSSRSRIRASYVCTITGSPPFSSTYSSADGFITWYGCRTARRLSSLFPWKTWSRFKRCADKKLWASKRCLHWDTRSK